MSFFGNPTPGTSTSLFATQNPIGSSTMFNVPGSNSQSTPFGSSSIVQQTGVHNPNKDIEVSSSPDDSIAGLAFSPPTLPQNFLISGSWDNQIRCWEIIGTTNAWQTIPKAQQSHAGPVLDVRFSDVSFVFQNEIFFFKTFSKLNFRMVQKYFPHQPIKQ